MHEGKPCQDLVLVDDDVAKLVDDIQLEEGVERVHDVMDKDSIISSTEVNDGRVVPTVSSCSSCHPQTHVDQMSKTEDSSSNLEKIAS